MPFGGNDWLALTQEPTLEPEMPICDAHHHFWDFRSQSIPYQRYLLHELAADVNSGHNVRSTVFLEARSMYRAEGPEEMRPVGEVEFVQGLAAASASGLYGPCRAAAAIVGHANLNLGERVEPVLEAVQAASPNRFRGIRHGVTWDPHPGVQSRETERKLADKNFRAGARVVARMGLSLDTFLYFPQLPEVADFARAIPELTIIVNHIGGLMRVGPYANRDDVVLPTWRSGIAAVARMGLSLDTFLYFPQLPEVADFARAIPELTIILNHIGGLMRVGPYANRDDAVLPTWRSGIAAVAACPNVTMKLGGMGMPWLGFDWHTRSAPIGSEELAEGMGPFMTYCIEQFGPERCMFESNFPPDKVSFSYNVMYNAFKRLSKGYSAAERAAMFHDTAARVYRIDV